MVSYVSLTKTSMALSFRGIPNTISLSNLNM